MIASHLLPDEQHKKTCEACEIDAGFFFPDGLTLGDVEARSASMLALSEAERHRLVEAAKSPTRQKRDFLGSIRAKLNIKTAITESEKKMQLVPLSPMRCDFVGPPQRFVVELDKTIRDRQQAAVENFAEQECYSDGSKTIILFREWSAEWKIRTQVDTTVGTKPPEQAGPRISVLLSQSGAVKIADACAYMAAKKGGFQTFITATFNAEMRAKIAAGETTIQREVTRTMDALSKMHDRGWFTSAGEAVAGITEPLAYCWVVEVPLNDQGEPNPHVHLLTNWRVEYKLFRDWSARIERIWGGGFFHLEKIDDPLCAGAYMAKAAGYLTKGKGETDQGIVTGNRYAINKVARAPAWQTIGTFQLGIMGHLIREVYDSIIAKHQAKFAERKKIRQERENIRALAKKAQSDHPKKQYPLWAKDALTRVGADLVRVRTEINALPIRATKWQLVIKSQDVFSRFLGWAKASGWDMHNRPDSHWYARFKRQLYLKKRLRNMWHGEWEIAEYLQQRVDRMADTFSSWIQYAEQIE